MQLLHEEAADTVTMTNPPLQIGMMIGSTANAGGGVAIALHSLTCALQQRQGISVDVFSIASADVIDGGNWAGARLHHHGVRGPSSFAYAPMLSRSLRSSGIDLLHLHGLWMYCSVATRRWGARSGKPCVISPHGMLDPWALANSGWKKRIARRLYEDANLRRAACLHALCEPERQAIRDCGLNGPICVIPNGVDLNPEVPAEPADWRRELPPDARVLLYLGRLHPKKRALELIQGWHLAQTTDPDAAAWHLVIAGPGPAHYVEQLQRQIVQLGLGERVRLIGPQYDGAKAAAFAAADAFVLPSLSEGMPYAVLEAWAAGLPALITPQCNLPEGFAAGAALQIEPNPEAIAAGLRSLFALPSESRRAIGRRGRELVAVRFTWANVAAEFEAVYRWMLGRGPRPSSIDGF